VLLALRQVIILMTIGIVAGGVAAILSTRLIRGFLYGVTSNNPFVLAGAALLLCVIALSASLISVRKVVHLDPVEALRRNERYPSMVTTPCESKCELMTTGRCTH